MDTICMLIKNAINYEGDCGVTPINIIRYQIFFALLSMCEFI